MNSVDFTSGAKPSVDFTKPIQAEIVCMVRGDIHYNEWADVTYIGPYEDKHVIADASGEYHTLHQYKLRNKPVKPTIKQLYDQCVYAAMVDGMPWANKQMLFELLYQELVKEGLIKVES